jgi:hypothetical protein
MKIVASSFVLLIGCAAGEVGKPTFSVTLKDGSFGDLKSALSPKIVFKSEEFGGSVDASTGGKSFWGEKSSSAGGWNLKTRVELSQGEYDFADGDDAGAYVTVTGNSDDEETYVWGSGAVSKKGVSSPLKVGAKKILSSDNGKFLVAPRYDFEDKKAEVVLGFEKDDTKAYLTVSEDSKDLLVQHKVDGGSNVSVKVADTGFVSASVDSDTDLGRATVTLTPDGLDASVTKDGWTALVETSHPILNSEPTVRFTKSLSFQP